VADVYSRRLSIIIGFFLIGIGMLIEGLFPVFGAIVLAQAVWGIGATFTSGASEAWITDEIGEERTAQAFMRSSQVMQIAGIVGIVLSVALASIQINLPIVIGGLLMVVMAVFLIVVMPENGFKRTPKAERTTWQATVNQLRAGIRLVRLRPVLLTFMLTSLVYGLYSEGFDRLWQFHLLDNFTIPGLGALQPIVWFGIIGIIASLFSIGLTEIVRRRMNFVNPGRLLGFIYGLMVVALLVYSQAESFGLAIAAYQLMASLRSTGGPVVGAWMNRHIESSVRATVFSMGAQMNAVGQIAGGPPVGWIGSRFSVRAALAVSGLILSLNLPLVALASRQQDAITVAESAAD
jgi:DHA3 family tetracycline resistance protein-like MFS transporter